MKAFEKWFGGEPICFAEWTSKEKVFCKVAWKAALEWALSTETYIGSAAENIEEELGTIRPSEKEAK